MWTRHMRKISSAAKGGPGWTPEQYLKTFRLLLESKHNVVLMDALEDALLEDGPGAVRAMVQAGLLGVRPQSGACLHAPLIFLR